MTKPDRDGSLGWCTGAKDSLGGERLWIHEARRWRGHFRVPVSLQSLAQLPHTPGGHGLGLVLPVRAEEVFGKSY